MFNLREYVKKGFMDAVGKMSSYQIILNSAGWMEKGVLTEDDLAEIQTAIEAWESGKNAVAIPVGSDDTADAATEDATEPSDDAQVVDDSQEDADNTSDGIVEETTYNTVDETI